MRIAAFILLVGASASAGGQTLGTTPQQANAVWQMQDSGGTAGLRGIDSVDGNVAWASGSGGTVLKTTDGGAHWEKCAVPDGATDGATLDFRGVQAWDATTAIVMASGPGDKSRLYKTTDECETWVLLYKNPDSPDGFFDSFWIDPAYKGVLVGDPVRGSFAVFETSDEGITWRRDNSKGLKVGPKPIAGFAASNSLVPRFGAGYMHGFVTGGQGGTFLIHRWATKYWSRSEIPLGSRTNASGGFSLAYRVTPPPPCTDCAGPLYQFTVAVGGDYTKPNAPTGTAAWSSDGGKTWTASIIPPHGYRSTVQWSESLKLWITAGTNGSDICRDDGRTWQPLDNGNWNALSLPFIVGPNGRIAHLNPAALPKP
jgi:hypothetical protein